MPPCRETLSLSLLSGIGQLSQFAFYVCVIMNVLAWIGVLCGMVKDEISQRIRRTFWIQLLPSNSRERLSVMLMMIEMVVFIRQSSFSVRAAWRGTRR